MERYQATVLRQGQVKVGHVAVSDEDFRVLADQVIIQIFHNTTGAVTSSDAEDGVHLRISEHPIDPLTASLTGAGHIAAVIDHQIVGQLDLISQRFYGIDAFLHSLSRNAGAGAYQTHGISRLQHFGKSHSDLIPFLRTTLS